MLNEHQMETLEKMFPKGFVLAWKGPKGRKRTDGEAGDPYGVFIFNPDEDAGLDNLGNFLRESGAGEP